MRGQCPRCGGSGYIEAFSHVLGGRCFKCGGSGKVAGGRSSGSKQWTIGAINRDGEVIARVFYLRAKSEAEALRKARAKLSRGAGYDPDSAFVADNES